MVLFSIQRMDFSGHLYRAETMVCFTAFSLKADQMPFFWSSFGLLFVKKSTFYEFPKK